MAGIHAVQLADELFSDVRLAAFIGILTDLITGGHHQVFTVLIGTVVSRQREHMTATDSAGATA